MTYLAVGLVGIVVGIINGMAGGASIISYPVLLWVGLPVLPAVVTNAVGVTTANFFALRAHTHSLWNLLRTNAVSTVASVVGTVIGATALLTLPIRSLEMTTPFLLLAATATLLMPTAGPATGLSPQTETAAIFTTGLYCGYFGPGQGVMVTAVLARDRRRSPALLNATKNAIVGVTALTSNVMYAVSGHVHWGYAGMLAAGAAVGGLYGGRMATTFSPRFYRGLVFVVGLCASVWLFVRYY